MGRNTFIFLQVIFTLGGLLLKQLDYFSGYLEEPKISPPGMANMSSRQTQVPGSKLGTEAEIMKLYGVLFKTPEEIASHHRRFRPTQEGGGSCSIDNDSTDSSSSDSECSDYQSSDRSKCCEVCTMTEEPDVLSNEDGQKRHIVQYPGWKQSYRKATCGASGLCSECSPATTTLMFVTSDKDEIPERLDEVKLESFELVTYCKCIKA